MSKPIIFSGAMVRAILDGRKTRTRRVVRPQPHECHNGDLIWKDRLVGSVLSERSWEQCGPYTEAYEVCPYGQPGDKLWVRETWRCFIGDYDAGAPLIVEYRADHAKCTVDPDSVQWEKIANTPGWRSSIFMPRWASRIELEVLAVRVERVQDISDEDVIAEGIDIGKQPYPENEPMLRDFDVDFETAFRDVWDSLNAKPRPAGYVDGRPTMYVSAPFDETSRDPRAEIGGLPHVCYVNPQVWVIEFRRLKP